MAYVDYKCLESLLIEGEDLIATEGIGDAIKSFISKIINIVIGFFKNIITMLGKMIGFIRNKLKMKEKGKLFEKKIKAGELVDITLDMKSFASNLQQVVNILRKPITPDMNVQTEIENLQNTKARLETSRQSIVSKTDKLQRKYTGEYTISALTAESFLNKLENNRNAFQTAYDKLKSIAENAMKTYVQTANRDYQAIFSSFSSLSTDVNSVLKSINIMNTIIVNATYYYGPNTVMDKPEMVAV